MALGINRRQVAAGAVGVLLGGSLSGCTSAGPLRVGIHPWPGYETLFLAQELGWLPASVHLVRGAASSDTLRGLHAQELDAGCLTLDEVLLARSEGVPLTVVAVLDESVGADQVLGRTAAPARGWRDARVGFEPSTVGHMVFNLWLQHEGLSAREVRPVPLGRQAQREAWASGQIDVVITYEPEASALRAMGGVRLYDSSHFPGLVLDVLAVHGDHLGWRSDALVQGLVRAHFHALEHLRVNPEDAMRRIARLQSTSYAETVASFGGLNQPQLTVNRSMLKPGGQLQSVAQRLVPVMQAARLLTGPVDLDSLGTDHYLPRG